MIGLEEERGQLDRRLRILLTQALEEIRGFEKFRWQLLVTLHVGGVKKNRRAAWHSSGRRIQSCVAE